MLITLGIDHDGDGSIDEVRQMLTDVNGEYWFTGLGPGKYTVTETPPPNASQSTPDPPVIELQSGQVYVAFDGQVVLEAGQTQVIESDLVFGNFIPGAGPDLTIEPDLSNLTDPVRAGVDTIVTVPVTITNIGDAPAVASIDLELRRSEDQVLNPAEDPIVGQVTGLAINLAPNGGDTVVNVDILIGANVAVGDYTIIAEVDIGDDLAERDEDNNVGVSADTLDVALLFGAVGGEDRITLMRTIGDDDVTFGLSGPGTGELVFNDALGAFDVMLTGTDDSTKFDPGAKGGDGVFNLADVTVDDNVGSVIISNVLGNITIDGSANVLTIDNIADDHVIEIGAPDDPNDSATFTAQDVTNTIINSEIGFKKFTINGDWTDTGAPGGDPDMVNAPWIGKFDINGSFGAGLMLTGVGAPKGVTLAKGTVDGNLGSGDSNNPVIWDITGDISKFDASKGVIEGWDLTLHSNIGKMKLGRIESANITLDDGAIKKLDFTQWNEGSLNANAVGKLTSKAGKKDPLATGDMRAAVTLTGPTSPLGKTKIAGDLGSGDGDNPVIWDLTGDVGKFDASKGTVEGLTFNVHSNVAGMKLGNVQQADITVGDPGDRGAINKFDFQQWERGTIITGTVNKLSSKPKLVGTNGDFKGTLTVEGTPTSLATDNTLNKLTIKGRMLDALIEVLVGNLAKATLGTMENSTIRVGVQDAVAQDELPDDANDFVAGAGGISKLSFKGLKGAPKTNPSFINSIVSAFTIGKASFKVVQTANGAVPHGLGATLITKLSGTNEDGAKLPKLSGLDVQQDVIDQIEGFDSRDFNLRVV